MPHLAVIGAGNVAWHLAPALETAGHPVTEVYSRSLNTADLLARRLYQAAPTQHLDFRQSPAQVFLLCLADDAYPAVLPQLRLPPGAILVHTSGPLPTQLLAPYCPQFGVLYPVQTFSKARAVNLAQVPFCIDASDAPTEQLLVALASGLSQQVYALDSTERQRLHLAAVFANNFTNYLLHAADQLLAAGQLPPTLLQALVAETVAKAQALGPAAAQTGPARRGDTEVLAKQEAWLQAHYPSLAGVYRTLSAEILKFYHQKPI